MGKYLFAILVFVYAFFHSLGFYMAFGLVILGPAQLQISEQMGLLWLIATVLFMIIAFAYLSGKKWAFITISAVGISQLLIINSWHQTKWATLVNIIILIILYPAFVNTWFRNNSKHMMAPLLEQPVENAPVVAEAVILPLPAIVQ